MSYETILESIKKGGMPNTVGLGFTDIQANEIKANIDLYKASLDQYYEVCIKVRMANP